MERYALAKKLILEAGAFLRGLEQATAAEKSGHQDLVTEYDQQTERFLRAKILSAFPGDAIVGEEFPASPGARVTWYIDPIDGTTNFINQRRNFAVSIACYTGDEPSFGLVLDVASNVLYHAKAGTGAFQNEVRLPRLARHTAVGEVLFTTPCIQHTFLEAGSHQRPLCRLAGDVRAVRSLGSVALELCSVAAGEADLFVALRSSPWDHNAARLILTEAGGAIGALMGGDLPINHNCPVIACGSPTLLAHIRSEYLHQPVTGEST